MIQVDQDHVRAFTQYAAEDTVSRHCIANFEIVGNFNGIIFHGFAFPGSESVGKIFLLKKPYYVLHWKQRKVHIQCTRGASTSFATHVRIIYIIACTYFSRRVLQLQ